jgi:hypothetical protein
MSRVNVITADYQVLDTGSIKQAIGGLDSNAAIACNPLYLN